MGHTLRGAPEFTIAGLVTVFATGCATYGAHPECPARGADPWQESASTHFRVVSDLPPEDADAIARELEAALSALEQIAFKNARAVVDPTTVVVFEDASDFHAFFPENAGGFFTDEIPSDAEPSRVSVLPGALTPSSRVTLLHELTHDLFSRNVGAAPPWLGEGFAQYYSTLRIKDSEAYVGGALPHITYTEERYFFGARTTDGQQVTAVPIDLVARPSALLSLDHQHFFVPATEDDVEANRQNAVRYLGSWAFVHMLMDGPAPYPNQFAEFLRTRIAGTPVDAAWDKAFAGTAAGRMDYDFSRYIASREVPVYKVPFAPSAPPPITHRALPDAEVHVLWGRLGDAAAAEGFRTKQTRAAAELDYEDAIRAAPNHPDAHFHRGMGRLRRNELALAAADLESAARLAPEDPRFLLGLAVLRSKQAKEESAPPDFGDLETRLMKRAESGFHFAALAELALLRQDGAAALERAQRAVSLLPVHPMVLDVYAVVLAGVGRPKDAVAVEERAIAFLPDGGNATVLTKHLADFKARASRQ